MIGKFVLPEIEYKGRHFPLDLQVIKRTVNLVFSPLKLALSAGVLAKTMRMRKGYLRLKELNGVLVAEGVTPFEYYDEVSTKDLLERGQTQVIKMVDESSRMVPELKALGRGLESYNGAAEQTLRLIRRNHYRAFVGPQGLFFFQPQCTVVLRQIQKIRVAQDESMAEAMGGGGVGMGVLCMDDRNLVLVRKLAPREHTFGVWLRNGSDQDLLHLILEYLISPAFPKKCQPRPGHLLVFRFRGKQPEIFLAQPLPARWAYHLVPVASPPSDVEVVLGPDTVSSRSSIKLEFEEEEDPRQSIYLGSEPERTVKQLGQAASLKSSIDICQDLRYDNLRKIIEGQNRMIKDLQAQNEHLLQIIFKQDNSQLTCSRCGSAQRIKEEEPESQPDFKLTRFSSYKEGSSSRPLQKEGWMKRSTHEYKSSKSTRFPDKQEGGPSFKARLNFEQTEKRSRADLTAYQYTLSKKDQSEDLGSLKNELTEIGLELEARESHKPSEVRQEKSVEPRIEHPRAQLKSEPRAQLRKEFKAESKPEPRELSQLRRQPLRQVQVKAREFLEDRKEERMQVVFPPRETPSLESVTMSCDKLSLGFLESFRKERGLVLPRRGLLEDSDESDSQIKKISNKY